MPLTPLLIALYVFAGLCALVSIGHGAGARRHWRNRRRFAAGHRVVWSTIFLALALLGAFAGTALLGYRRLTDEALVAKLSTRAIGPEQYAVRLDLPDGSHRGVELAGDEWQLDAHVIKWEPRAVVLGAPPLYRLDRISGRYRDVAREQSSQKSAVALSTEAPLDLWNVKRRFPAWLPWIDADYGSGAYLPLVDGGTFAVTLAPTGGLIARPSDAATIDKLKAAGW